MLGVAHLALLDRTNARLDRGMAALNAADRSAAVLRLANTAFERADRDIVDLAGAVEKIDRTMPTGRDFDQILTELAKMAEANSLQSMPRRTDNADASVFASTQPPRRAILSFIGDFNGVYSFLLQVEKRSTGVAVRSLKLEKSTDRDGQVLASLELEPIGEVASPPAITAISRRFEQ